MDEEKLIRKSREGDEAAFGELVTSCREKIMRHCASIVHDEEAAQDLVQETFLRAYTHLNTFAARSSFYTWVWRIAHNLSLNYVKKNRNEELFDENIGKSAQLSTEMYDEVLALLPPKQRVVFALYYIENLSQKEIGERLNIPYGTVRSRLHYAREKLASLRDFIE
ncbi:MAG: RNA polymerase sigma factor [Chlamydiales bacterium]